MLIVNLRMVHKHFDERDKVINNKMSSTAPTLIGVGISTNGATTRFNMVLLSPLILKLSNRKTYLPIIQCLSKQMSVCFISIMGRSKTSRTCSGPKNYLKNPANLLCGQSSRKSLCHPCHLKWVDLLSCLSSCRLPCHLLRILFQV